jgi:hypothetical protein
LEHVQGIGDIRKFDVDWPTEQVLNTLEQGSKLSQLRRCQTELAAAQVGALPSSPGWGKFATVPLAAARAIKQDAACLVQDKLVAHDTPIDDSIA